MSTITLYKHCKIEEERNFIVDSISAYLTTLISDEFTNYQYIKQGLDTEIKVALSQDNIGLSNTLDFNYCKVSNDNLGNDYYYFVRNILWTSKNTIKLVLRLDTLNTFNGNYSLDKQTKILRQHEDRFEHPKAYEVNENIGRDNFGIPITPGQYPYVYEYDEETEMVIDRTITPEIKVIGSTLMIQPQIKTVNIVGNKVKIHLEWASNPSLWKSVELKLKYSASTNIVRKINKISEGILPTLYKKEENYLNNEKYENNENWYLVYRSVGGDGLVRTFLTKDETFNVLYQNATPSKTILPEDLIADTFYYLDFATQTKDNPNGNGTGEKNNIEVKTEDGTLIAAATVPGRKATVGGVIVNIAEVICYRLNVNKITVFKQVYYKANNDDNGGWKYLTNIAVGSNYDKITLNSVENYLIYEKSSLTKARSEIRNGTATSVSTTPVTKEIIGFNQLNRYDTTKKYIKIIEIPYAPIDIDFDEQNNYYIINSSNTSVIDNEIEINGEISSQINLTGGENVLSKAKEIVDIHPTAYDVRNDKLESKMFNSEFYMPKIVYDNFTIDFKLEFVNETIDSEKWSVGFRVSQALGNSMLFTFNDYVCEAYEQDYNSILYINRNNQCALYDSAYIDYIKTGYNYDVKQQYLTIAQSGYDTIMNTIEGAKYGGWAGAIAGAVKGIASTITTASQQKMAQQQKLFQLSMQSVNIRDCDDLDVFNEYSNNKLKLVIYKPSEKQMNDIKDLFYYFGYNQNVMGKPNTNSRTWFNFVQCNPVFEKKSTSAFLNIDIKNDIIERYNNGVTIMHNVNGEYDFDQVKENYETWLFN